MTNELVTHVNTLVQDVNQTVIRSCRGNLLMVPLPLPETAASTCRPSSYIRTSQYIKYSTVRLKYRHVDFYRGHDRRRHLVFRH